MRLALLAAAALLALTGCMLREAVTGVVAEPQVVGTPSPSLASADLSLLAVITDAGKWRDVDLSRALADEAEQVALFKGYRLASRADLTRVVDELRLQHSGWTDADAAKIGKVVNVPALLIVTLADDQVIDDGDGLWSYRCAVSARLVSVEQGEVLWIAGHNGVHHLRSPGERQAVIRPVVRGVVRALPSR